jgi:LacI family transcriptional regulator
LPRDDRLRQLISGDDIADLQVLWQPEFSAGKTA